MGDPVKAKYLRHNVEYVRDSHLYQEWFVTCAEAILRVTKPGAHLLSFGGTRMWHRMACAIEDAGFEVRDAVMWVYGSGFPKSMDISKAIDKMHGVEREVMGRSSSGLGAGQFTTVAGVDGGYGFKSEYDVTEPATEDAEIWRGWGTSLKPAWEPVIVARKPLVGTAAECSLEHGCGGINVDACRVGTEGGSRAIAGSEPDYLNNVYGTGMGGNPKDPNYKAGRWPANVVHDGSEEVVGLFPAQAGGGSANRERHSAARSGAALNLNTEGSVSANGVGHNDSGSAARFFYAAKADDSDRPHGKGSTTHPTVKPLDLMRYLVRLVCLRGGTVLDPFMGSGSTGCAALEEGMAFVGVEQSQEYADIAVGRLKLALQHAPDYVGPVTRAPQRRAGDAPKPKRMR
jgi:DNA methylase